jgi:D-sedoheptulose 7-phosphate isomerase
MLKDQTQKIKTIISNSIEVKNKILDCKDLLFYIEAASNAIINSLSHGNRIYFCGNGGSAADAQHLAAEFSGRFYLDRKALPAEALHCNTSYLTAVGNDYGYDLVYSRLVEGICNEGDVLIGLSTSGNSKNILNAIKSAKLRGVFTIGFTGYNGGYMKSFSDLIIAVPSSDTPRIQEVHIMIGHIICELVECALFPKFE